MEGSPSNSAPAPDEAEVHPLFMTSLPPGWEDNPGLQAIAAVIDEADSAAMEVGGADGGGGGDDEDTDGADTDGAVSGLQSGSDGDGSSDDDYDRPSNSRSKSKPAKSAGKKKVRRVGDGMRCEPPPRECFSNSRLFPPRRRPPWQSGRVGRSNLSGGEAKKLRQVWLKCPCRCCKNKYVFIPSSPCISTSSSSSCSSALVSPPSPSAAGTKTR